MRGKGGVPFSKKGIVFRRAPMGPASRRKREQKDAVFIEVGGEK